MEIGRKIYSARRELGKDFTQEKLAEELRKYGVEIQRTWVADLESGRLKKIDRAKLEALSKSLKKPIEFFSDVTIRDDPTVKLNFPVALEKKIHEESERRLVNFETTVLIILSEYFTKKLGDHK
jgi:transcriptional regulator with XRE-family HTH domain